MLLTILNSQINKYYFKRLNILKNCFYHLCRFWDIIKNIYKLSDYDYNSQANISQ